MTSPTGRFVSDDEIDRLIDDAVTPRACDVCSAPEAKPQRDRFGSGIDYLCDGCHAAQEAPTFDPDAPIDLTDRAAILRWLLRNDRNGCYGDRETRGELQDEPMTLEAAVKMYRYFMYDEDPN